MDRSSPPANVASSALPGRIEEMEAAAHLQPLEPQGFPSIAELTPGRALAGRYACVRKDRLTARNGSTYLSLELRDRTGTLPARVFRDVDRIAAGFERGDPVEVRGRVERFRGQLVAELEDVRRIESEAIDPAEFLPAAYRNREELEGFLEHLLREVHDPALRDLAERILLAEPIASQFRRAPCTRAGHHAYLGGLLEHTVAVATLVPELVILHPRLDSDLLMTAALLHDVGKAREFTYGAEIGLTDEGRLLGHVELGLRLLEERGRAAGLDDARRLALAHCVLTHHGPDAAPGRRFGSAEALALYRLNALDAAVKGALEHGLPN
jgi:3'-5' exoribonuclease